MSLPRTYTPQILGLLTRAGLAERPPGPRRRVPPQPHPRPRSSLLDVVEAGDGRVGSARCILRGGPCGAAPGRVRGARRVVRGDRVLPRVALARRRWRGGRRPSSCPGAASAQPAEHPEGRATLARASSRRPAAARVDGGAGDGGPDEVHRPRRVPQQDVGAPPRPARRPLRAGSAGSTAGRTAGCARTARPGSRRTAFDDHQRRPPGRWPRRADRGAGPAAPPPPGRAGTTPRTPQVPAGSPHHDQDEPRGADRDVHDLADQQDAERGAPSGRRAPRTRAAPTRTRPRARSGSGSSPPRSTATAPCTARSVGRARRGRTGRRRTG